MNPIPLGPFELRAVVGKGGMGTVWSGVHRADGVPVAVKLLGSGQRWGPELLQLFQNEVRAVAALHHPAVVMLLDAGQVSRETAEASGGHIAPGTPYLVMELCSGGTLWPQRGRLPWTLLQPLLLSLLDALAHAHARGVIHRDLKPGNVLIGTGQDLRPGPKLTDFGIARLEEVEIFGEGTFAGSMSYAPPEQLLGRSRLVGPWTDLYALGVMTWDLVCAQTPWRGLGHARVCEAKLARDLPPWEPLVVVPDGLRDWIEALLAPLPSERPAYAADAAWSLRRLEAPPDLGWGPAAPLPALGHDHAPTGTDLVPFLDSDRGLRGPDAATVLERHFATHLDEPVALGAVEPSAEWGLGGPTDPSAPRPGRRERPPLLDDWRRRDPPSPPMQLIGAGLGLYSLRTLPMVDRDTERDRIWSGLHDVARTGAARCLLVRGPSGVGKSRLVQWMSERAHELGMATTLAAVHGPTPGIRDGVGPMIRRRMNLDGLSDADAAEALRGQLERLGDHSDWLYQGLLGLVLPYSPQGRALAEQRPEERLAYAVRWIGLLARDRPVMLWLDDLQWARGAIALARALLAGRRVRRHPVLVIGTVRDEGVVAGSAAQGALAGLAADEATETLVVDRLPDGDQQALVAELLRLDPELQGEVVARTGGNPLFAVQLVGDWVRRGILVPAAEGFQRAPGEDATLPDDIHGLWLQRFRGVLGGRPAAERMALELGAALGERVDRQEWEALCAEAGIAAVAHLPGFLADHGLAWSEAREWAFVHAMARESVERASRESGRWTEANAAAARMLQGRSSPAETARRAHHHAQAGAWGAAARDLRTAIEAWLPRRESALAQDAIALRLRCLDAADGAEDDPRRLENRFYALRLARLRQDAVEPGELEALGRRAGALGLSMLRAEILREWGVALRDHARLSEAADALREAVAAAEDLGSDVALGRALPALGWALTQAGQHPEARRVLRRAASVCARTEPRGMAVAYGALAMSYRREGRFGQAESYADRALKVAEKLDDAFLLAEACVQKAAVLMDAGRADEAPGLLKRARRIHERLGSMASLIALHSQEGNLLRHLGRLDEAESTLNAGIELQLDRGGWLLGLLRANLGKVQLAQAAWASARASLGTSAAVLRASERDGLATLVELLALPALVALGDRAALTAALDAAEGAAEGWARFDEETWQALGQAATLARRAGWGEAERLAELATRYGQLRP